MGSCMSVEPPARKVNQTIYAAPSADYVKPSAPVYTNYTYPPQQTQQQYQPQTQWVNPPYQGQVYSPQQQQQYQQQQYQQYQVYQYQQPQYVVAQPLQQQNQGQGLAIAGGLVAGMLAANIIDDITDPY